MGYPADLTEEKLDALCTASLTTLSHHNPPTENLLERTDRCCFVPPSTDGLKQSISDISVWWSAALAFC